MAKCPEVVAIEGMANDFVSALKDLADEASHPKTKSEPNHSCSSASSSLLGSTRNNEYIDLIKVVSR
jgi:hypothetical protein